MPKNCIICNSVDCKYKCPKCLAHYCSVACCNKHKSEKCELAAPAPKPATVEAASNEEREPQLYPTADTVDTRELQSLSNSEKLKVILENPHLKSLLKDVNESSNAADAMAKAMQEPIFMEFSNCCLDLIDADKRA